MGEVTITEPAILIRIAQLYEPGMSPDQLYEATRGERRIGLGRELHLQGGERMGITGDSRFVIDLDGGFSRKVRRRTGAQFLCTLRPLGGSTRIRCASFPKPMLEEDGQNG